MHNIKDIRKNLEQFKKSINKRFVDIDINKLNSLDKNHRKLIQEKESLENEKKDISKKKDKSLFEKSKKISVKISDLCFFKIFNKSWYFICNNSYFKQ